MVFHLNHIKILANSYKKFLVPSAVVIFLLLAITVSLGNTNQRQDNFVRVNGTRFEVNGTPYYFVGTNFWYGLNLGSKGTGGDRKRLLRELDKLKSMGITNLRIMAASEGPDTEPWRMKPALQKSPGVYNQEVLDGLDFLLNEMGKRNMYAVVCLSNFWPWSGGMAQYIKWQDRKRHV